MVQLAMAAIERWLGDSSRTQTFIGVCQSMKTVDPQNILMSPEGVSQPSLCNASTVCNREGVRGGDLAAVAGGCLQGPNL